MTAAPLLIALMAGAAGTMTLLGVTRLASAPTRRVRQRLAATAPASMDFPDIDLLRDRRASTLGPLDALLRRREWTERTRVQLDRAGIPLRVGEYAMLRGGTALAGAVGGYVVASVIGVRGLAWLLVPAGALVGAYVPALWVAVRIRRRAEEIESQLVQLCDVMAAMVASGFGYLQSLQTASERVPEPLSGEIRRLLDEVTLGADVDQSLADLNTRLNSADFDIVATGIAIQRSTGGNLGDILHGVASTIRGRQALKREIGSLTSQQRLSAIVVAAIPFVLVTVLGFLLPDPFARLLTEPSGRLMLAVSVLLDGMAFITIRRVARLDA
ncbi:MAG: type II secretion system F family protein [Dehalococcoidia bacterium]